MEFHAGRRLDRSCSHSREALKAISPNGTRRSSTLDRTPAFRPSRALAPRLPPRARSPNSPLEAINHGIPVNGVGSGDVVTTILNSFRSDGREFLAEHGKTAPIKRSGRPEEIAEVVAFLASDKASFIVSAMVTADRGISIAVPVSNKFKNLLSS